MFPFALLPLPIALVVVALVGLAAGAAVNWAAYGLAFHPRRISPWSKAPEDAPRRRALDRLPVLGWLGLRREAAIHGRGFWIRPLAVELLMAAGFAALYWWEVERQGLVAGQFAALGAVGVAPQSALLATFFSHAALLVLMTAVSLIDLDEKTVPSVVTDWGTLLGLAIAAVAPMALLPTLAVRQQAPIVGVEAQLAPAAAAAIPGTWYVEPTTPVAPGELSAMFSGWSEWPGLAIALGCYALWCFALAPRIWRKTRGRLFGLRVLLARVARELGRPPLLWFMMAGFPAIVAIWFCGGAAWTGLITALAGMIGASAMVWAVRIAGTTALGREAMGFGDVTFMMMVGAFLGWQAGIVVFFLAPFAGLVVGVLQAVLRRDDEIPYVPYLCLATLLVMVRWADVWHAPPGGLQLVFEIPWLVAALLAGCVALLWITLVFWAAIKRGIAGER